MVSANRAVLIRNSHGASRTSRAKAEKYVSTGRARYLGPRTIEFFADDSRHQAVGRAAQAVFIDGGMATLDAIAGLPVIHPVQLITLQTKRSRLNRAA